MTDIWTQHRKAFAGVAAWAIAFDGTAGRAATIAIHASASGMTVTAYLHVYGVDMVRGSATGFGYDKYTAAISKAAANLPEADRLDPPRPDVTALVQTIKQALTRNDGDGWESRLRDARLSVFQVV